MVLAAAGFGVLIGAVVGLLGAGGSVLAIPALVYGVGLDVPEAVTTSLFAVGLSAAVAGVPRALAGQVRWNVAAMFAAAGIGTAFAGTAVNAVVPDRALLLAFAGLLVVVASAMFVAPAERRGTCASGGRPNWRRCLPRALAAGAVVGFLTGLFGVGGGFIIVPALVLLLGLDMQTAIGTSLAIMVVNVVSGLGAHLRTTAIDWGLAIAFAGLAVVSSLVAARISGRFDSGRLRGWFAALLVAVAIFMAVQAALGTP